MSARGTARSTRCPTDPEPGPVTPRWTFDVTDQNEVAFGRIVSSAAVTDIGGDRVVMFGGGATLYALDAADGGVLAELCLDPRAIAGRCQGSDDHIEIESSPAVVEIDGVTWVIVGFDVHNNGGVGRTGVVAAKLVPGASGAPARVEVRSGSRRGVPRRRSAHHRFGHRGRLWRCVVVAARSTSKLGRVFFGTASCSADGVTSGESLWSVDLESGELGWVYHPPRDSTRLDDDFGASPNLLLDGQVGNGGKDGWYYSLDRQTGELDWASHAGQAGHLNEDFAVGGMLGSSAVGSVAGEPAIFVTTAISTPFGQSFAPDDELAEDPGRLISIHAIAADDGAVLWRSPLSRQSYGSASFAGGVVFVPSTFDDRLVAFDADTGLPLWSAPLIGPSSSTPVVVGDSVYIGSGTRTSDVEFKMFGAGAFDPAPRPLAPLTPQRRHRVRAGRARLVNADRCPD